jgi:hypothetical protein
MTALPDKDDQSTTTSNKVDLEEINYLRDRVRKLLDAKDQAYTERNRLVAFLARVAYNRGHVVSVTKTEIEGWDPAWHNCVYVELPHGQVSWHFHEDDAHLFKGLPVRHHPWDGHTTEEKYARIADCDWL